MFDKAFVLCSRFGSSRLPGKAFLKAAGRTLLGHALERIRGAIPVVLAVPAGEEYLYAEEVKNRPGVWLMGGDPASPLHRTAEAVRRFGVRWVVRVTHDDPLVDLRSALELLDHAESAGLGYCISAGILEGAGSEVIHADNILAAAERRKEPTEFISYFVRGPGMPRPGSGWLRPRDGIARDYRITVDYSEDLNVLRAVLNHLGPDATNDEICSYLDMHPSVLNANRLPLLSVYTCARNAGKYVSQAADSVLRTRIDGLEYVMVDDGSDDETLARMCSFGGSDGARILVNESNLGLASASNVAVAACRGKYVMRLDADDMLAPGFGDDFLHMAAILDGGFEALYPAYRLVGEDGTVLSGPQDPRMCHHAGGAIFRRSFLNEIRFRDGARHWDSLELYARIVAAGGRIAYYDAPTWDYRQTKDSLSRNPANRPERERVKP